MVMSVLVSIIVPIYNVGDFLDSTLHSIRSQSYENWELILVDDGSTDNSLEVAKYHAAGDARIRILSQSHKGVSIARNLGLSDARGESVIFVDGDDLWLPESLRLLVERQQQCGATLVYGAQEHLRESGSLDNLGTFYPTGHILLAAMREDFVHIGASLIRREFLITSQIQFTPYAARSQDMEFIWKLLCLTAVESVPEIVQIRRFRHGSATNSDWSWELDIHSIGCYERTWSFVAEKYDRPDKSAVLRLLSQKTAYLRFRALWKKMKTGDDQTVLAFLTETGWTNSLANLDPGTMTMPQKLQRRLLLSRRTGLWSLYRRLFPVNR
jgi:glycosyltransferase involved in cell wall biosynthesis